MATVQNVLFNQSPSDYPRGLSRSAQVAVAAMNQRRGARDAPLSQPSFDPWDDQPSLEPQRAVQTNRTCSTVRTNPKDQVGVDFRLDEFDPEGIECGLGNLRDRRPLFQRGQGFGTGPVAQNNAAYRIQQRRDDAARQRANNLEVNDLDQEYFPGAPWSGAPEDLLRRPTAPPNTQPALGFVPNNNEGVGQAIQTNLNGGFIVQNMYQDLQKLDPRVLQLKSDRDTNRAFTQPGQSILSVIPQVEGSATIQPKVKQNRAPVVSIFNDFDAPVNVDTESVDLIARSTVENPISSSQIRKIKDTIVPEARVPEVQVESSFDKILSRALPPNIVRTQGNNLPAIPQDMTVQPEPSNALNLLPAIRLDVPALNTTALGGSRNDLEQYTIDQPLQPTRFDYRSVAPIPITDPASQQVRYLTETVSLEPSLQLYGTLRSAPLQTSTDMKFLPSTDEVLATLPPIQIPTKLTVNVAPDNVPFLLPTDETIPILPVDRTLDVQVRSAPLLQTEILFPTESTNTVPLTSQSVRAVLRPESDLVNPSNWIGAMMTEAVDSLKPIPLQTVDALVRPAQTVPSGPWDGRVQKVDDWQNETYRPPIVEQAVVSDSTVIPFVQAFSHQPPMYDGDLFTIFRDEHSTKQVRQLARPKEYLSKQPDRLDELVNETQRLLLQTTQAQDPLTKTKREARSLPMELREVLLENGNVNQTIMTKRQGLAIHDMIRTQQINPITSQTNPMDMVADFTDSSDFAF